MQITDIETYDDLKTYLREFTNVAGAPTYDFVGAFNLLDALLENLAEQHIDADIESLVDGGVQFTPPQLAFLDKLNRLQDGD
tara:strand:+ start:1117 stop:1362 length:246 start_codon:yes stop_codon:yes gene_type:complete